MCFFIFLKISKRAKLSKTSQQCNGARAATIFIQLCLGYVLTATLMFSRQNEEDFSLHGNLLLEPLSNADWLNATLNSFLS